MQDAIFSFCSGINALGSFLFGLFVLSRNQKSKLHQLWFCMSLAVMVWGGLHALFFAPIEYHSQIRLMLVRLANTGAIFIPLFYLHFIITFLQLQTQKPLLITCYFLTLALAAFTWTPLFIPMLKPQMGLSNYPVGGPLFLAFFVLYTFEAGWSNWLLWETRKITDGPRKAQITYIFAATTLGFLVGGTSFLPAFDIKFHPIGMCFVWLYNLLLTWAVFRHQLFDIQLVIRKSLVYSLLVTLLTIGYFGLAYGVERIFQTTFGYRSIWISLVSFSLMAFLFQPLKIVIQRLVDLIIFRVPQEELAKRLERLEDEARLAEKQRAIATLAAGMAHEIKNPLTSLKTFAEFIPEKGADPEFRKRLHEVLTHETQRIQGIVQDLLEFAKPKPPQFKSIDLKSLIDSTANLLSGELSKHHVRWSADYQHNGAQIQADPDQLRQILINLIQNASDAMPNGGQLTITTQTNDGYLEMRISDTGTGIPKELLPKIFEPFVTTKPNGTGLGLAMVRSLIHAHHGTITVDSRPGAGTTFTLRLPL